MLPHVEVHVRVKGEMGQGTESETSSLSRSLSGADTAVSKSCAALLELASYWLTYRQKNSKQQTHKISCATSRVCGSSSLSLHVGFEYAVTGVTLSEFSARNAARGGLEMPSFDSGLYICLDGLQPMLAICSSPHTHKHRGSLYSLREMR